MVKIVHDKTISIDWALLNSAMTKTLPLNYDFQLATTVKSLLRDAPAHLALQMPDGLTQYATRLASIFRRMIPSIKCVSILGDSCFGACCVDDITCVDIGATTLIHYGHSCLVPIDQSRVKTIYVHVKINFPVDELCSSLAWNIDKLLGEKMKGDNDEFSPQVVDQNIDSADAGVFENITDNVPGLRHRSQVRIALMGTVQFTQLLPEAQDALILNYGFSRKHIVIPQSKPLGPGEVLGCTAPSVSGIVDIIVFVADGRFHLEAAIMASPDVPIFWRYCPYVGRIFREKMDIQSLMSLRKTQMDSCVLKLRTNDDSDSHKESAYPYSEFPRKLSNTLQKTYVKVGVHRSQLPLDKNSCCKDSNICLARPDLLRVSSKHRGRTGIVGIILGTLGRQGSVSLLDRIRKRVNTIPGLESTTFLVSDINGHTLESMNSSCNGSIIFFVQIACPRLSLDWDRPDNGGVPLLSSFEAFRVLENFTMPIDSRIRFEDSRESKGGLHPMDYYSHEGGPWSNYYVKDEHTLWTRTNLL